MHYCIFKIFGYIVKLPMDLFKKHIEAYAYKGMMVVLTKSGKYKGREVYNVKFYKDNIDNEIRL